MKHNEVIFKAKSWIEEYEEEIKPHLKSCVIYSPRLVGYLCDRMSALSLFQAYLGSYSSMEEEGALLNKFNEIEKDFYQTLESKEHEFDLIEKQLKQEYGLELVHEHPNDDDEESLLN